MLRATAIGFVSAVALSVGLAIPAQAHMNGGGSMHGSVSSGGGGGMMMRSGGPGPSLASHDVGHDVSRMHVDRDHDGDRDRDHDHDHDRFRHFRFFPSFAVGFDTYADYDDYTCWEVVRVRTHLGWRFRRIWVCD